MKPSLSVRLHITSCFYPFRRRLDGGSSFIREGVFWSSGTRRVEKSIDLSARMPSEWIIKELSELEAGKGIYWGWGMDMWEGL